MSVATHNLEAQRYAAQLLLIMGDATAQTQHFRKWIAARVTWEANGILEALTVDGVPVTAFYPDGRDELDTWAN
jgi:hypothetical protein